MKITTRITTLCVAIALVVSSLVLPANAATTTQEKTAYSFNQEWEYTVNYRYKPTNVFLGSMTYGFDTDWIHEDYVWARGAECKVQGFIKRINYDTTWQSDGKSSDAWEYSKTEITHRSASTSVKYKMVFDATYGSNLKEDPKFPSTINQ